MTTYQVHVTREGDQWLADVPDLEGTQTYASNLSALDRYVREIIVLGADLPDEAMSGLVLAWTYDIGDQLVERANALRAERIALTAKEKQLEQETRELAAKLTQDLGYSLRDAGPLLGISHQRVSQLKPEGQGRDGNGQGDSAGLRPAAAARSGGGATKGARVAKAAAKKAPAKVVPARKSASRKGTPSKAAPIKAAPGKKKAAPIAAEARETK